MYSRLGFGSSRVGAVAGGRTRRSLSGVRDNLRCSNPLLDLFGVALLARAAAGPVLP